MPGCQSVTLRVVAATVLAALLVASPALAQKKEKQKDKTPQDSTLATGLTAREKRTAKSRAAQLIKALNMDFGLHHAPNRRRRPGRFRDVRPGLD